MNHIWVKGPRDGHVYREEYIYEYIMTALEILNLTPEWTDAEYDITVQSLRRSLKTLVMHMDSVTVAAKTLRLTYHGKMSPSTS